MSVHKLASRNLWFAKWNEKGKEKRKYFKTEQEARSFEMERLEAAQQDTRLTLGELTMLYFRSHPERNAKTKKNLVYFLAGHENANAEHIEGPGEFLRDKYAESLSRHDLERLREAYRVRGTSNATMNRYQAYIKAILSWGVEQELIAINPWRDFKLLKSKKFVSSATVEDLRKLYQFLPEYLQWAVKTAFFLALRPGQVELFSLCWTAFNWRRGLVIVRQGKSGLLKTVFPHPAYLEEARERYEEDMKAGIPLVCHRRGQKVLSFRTAWLNACKEAGVKMRPYDIRHIAASEMLAHGADLAAVAAQLGHQSVATTGATYAHVTAGSQSRAAQLMPALSDTDSDTKVIRKNKK